MKIHSLASLVFVLISVFAASAQEQRVITAKDLTSYFQRSEKATGGLPFRHRTFIETGETYNGPWKPYSSWIMEVIRPDRSRITYTSGRDGDFIHIGKVSYSKGRDGTWVETDKDVIYGSTDSPSAPRVFASNPHNSFTEHSEGGTVVVTVSSRKEVDGDPADSENYTYHYYFDNKGILIRHVSFAHNGRNWVKRTENYDYDPNIRIEAPGVGK